MTPMAQVTHVFWKDLREHRLRVIAFALVVAAAAARASGVPLPVPGVSLALVALLTGAVIVGAPVLAESPSDPRASWATRPLAPEAVLGAKLAFALLLVLLAAGAQWLALATFDLPMSEAWRHVAGPAAGFGTLLLAALVVAAATTDGRNHLLLVLAILFGLITLGQLTASWRMPGFVAPLATWLVPLLMLGALAYFFRSRRAGFAPIAVAFLVVSLGAFALAKSPQPRVVPPSAMGDVPRAELELTIPEHAKVVEGGAVRLRIRARQSLRGWQYSIQHPVAYATLQDGRTIRLEADEDFMNLGGDPGPVPLPAERVGAWSLAADASSWREVRIAVAAADRDAEGDTVVRATFRGQAVVTALRAVDTIPLRLHAVHTRQGIRSRIDSLTTVGGRPEIRLHAEGIMKRGDEPRVFPFSSYFGRSYALLGTDGRPPVPLQQTWASSSDYGLVLLTRSFGDVDLHLELFPAAVTAGGPAAPPSRPDEAWLASARLLAIEPTLRGSYPVNLAWARGN